MWPPTNRFKETYACFSLNTFNYQASKAEVSKLDFFVYIFVAYTIKNYIQTKVKCIEIEKT